MDELLDSLAEQRGDLREGAAHARAISRRIAPGVVSQACSDNVQQFLSGGSGASRRLFPGEIYFLVWFSGFFCTSVGTVCSVWFAEIFTRQAG
ncbi:hypothetical protein [Nocardia sp. NBC_00403]|uniref:hypothetical protein n=1 Tax=Nocardia sp. NBC_00403 TaxID=2975990 RepID=UPI002E1EA35C